MSVRKTVLVGSVVGLVMSGMILVVDWNVGMSTRVRHVLWPSSAILSADWCCTVHEALITISPIAINCLVYVALALLLRAGIDRVSGEMETLKVQTKMRCLRNAHEVLGSLNVGFSIAYALLVFGGRMGGYDTGVLRYVDNLLHIDRMNAVGLEIAFVAVVSVVTMLTFVFLQLIRWGPVGLSQVTLGPVAAVVAVAAAPALWIYALRSSGLFLFFGDDYPSWPTGSPWLSIGLEVSLVFTIIYITQIRKMSLWYALTPLLIHYCYWASYMWTGISHAFPFSAPAYLSIVCPCSGLAWLFHVRALRWQPHSRHEEHQ